MLQKSAQPGSALALVLMCQCATLQVQTTQLKTSPPCQAPYAQQSMCRPRQAANTLFAQDCKRLAEASTAGQGHDLHRYRMRLLLCPHHYNHHLLPIVDHIIALHNSGVVQHHQQLRLPAQQPLKAPCAWRAGAKMPGPHAATFS